MLQENTGELVIPGKKSLQLVDVPGHARIREAIIDRYAGRLAWTARGRGLGGNPPPSPFTHTNTKKPPTKVPPPP